VSWKSLIALGISGGLLPCPSALVVLLGAISLHRIGLGLLLVVAFSAGLATVLVAIGLSLVLAGKVIARWQDMITARHALLAAMLRTAAPVLPAVSALTVTAIGIVMTFRAIDGSGFL
jgi:ABC-type nickel/cobalt efflux system permease component RcnA